MLLLMSLLLLTRPRHAIMRVLIFSPFALMPFFSLFHYFSFIIIILFFLDISYFLFLRLRFAFYARYRYFFSRAIS